MENTSILLPPGTVRAACVMSRMFAGLESRGALKSDLPNTAILYQVLMLADPSGQDRLLEFVIGGSLDLYILIDAVGRGLFVDVFLLALERGLLPGEFEAAAGLLRSVGKVNAYLKNKYVPQPEPTPEVEGEDRYANYGYL